MQDPIQPNFMNGYNNVARHSPQDVSNIVGAAIQIGQKITGQSRIDYQPYQWKMIQYENRNRVERIPRTRKVTEYQERRVVEEVPREVIKTEYMAVEKQIQYVKQIIPEKTVEMVSVPKTRKRIEYVAVQKKTIKAPEQILRTLVNTQGLILNNNVMPVQMPVQSSLSGNVANTNFNVQYLNNNINVNGNGNGSWLKEAEMTGSSFA